MAMRETVRSLRLYFVLTAVLGGALNVIALARPIGFVAQALSVVGILFALAYLYLGLRLRHLLSNSEPDYGGFGGGHCLPDPIARARCALRLPGRNTGAGCTRTPDYLVPFRER